MRLAVVRGTVTATVRTSTLQRDVLLVVEPVDGEGKRIGDDCVAIDTVGAGPGDLVLLASGSAARQAPETRARPADLTIVAIVDSVDIPPSVGAGASAQRRKQTTTTNRRTS